MVETSNLLRPINNFVPFFPQSHWNKYTCKVVFSKAKRREQLKRKKVMEWAQMSCLLARPLLGNFSCVTQATDVRPTHPVSALGTSVSFALKCMDLIQACNFLFLFFFFSLGQFTGSLQNTYQGTIMSVWLVNIDVALLFNSADMG